MQLQLLITASAGTLSRILAICAEDDRTGVHVIGAAAPEAVAPNAPTTGTQAPSPVSLPLVSAPTPVAPSDDDETGDVVPTGATDKEGLPWDERIHSNPAKQTNKGVWRKRRGVDDATIASVEAELRNAAPAPVAPPVTDAQWQAAAPPAPVAAPVTPPPAPAPVAMPVPPSMPPLPTPADVSQVPTAPMAIPSLPPVPTAPEPAPAPVPTPPAPPAVLDFNGFMQHIASKVGTPGPDGAPGIDTDYLSQRVAEINGAWTGQPGFTALSVITDIAASPLSAQLVEYAKQLLVRDNRW